MEQMERIIGEYRAKDSGRESGMANERVQRLEGEIVRLQNTLALLRQEN